MEYELEKYKHFAPGFYNKVNNIEAEEDAEQLLQIAEDFVLLNQKSLQIDQLYDHHKKFIGTGSPKKISKDDFMNFAGHSYDEYINQREDEAEEHPDAQRTSGGRRKRSSKTRRSMKKGNKKKRMKTRRRK